MKWLITYSNGERGEVEAPSRYWAMISAQCKNEMPTKIEPVFELVEEHK
jgi:hypothetical protein